MSHRMTHFLVFLQRPQIFLVFHLREMTHHHPDPKSYMSGQA